MIATIRPGGRTSSFGLYARWERIHVAVDKKGHVDLWLIARRGGEPLQMRLHRGGEMSVEHVNTLELQKEARAAHAMRGFVFRQPTHAFYVRRK